MGPRLPLLPLVLALSALLLSAQAANISYGIPYGQCVAPPAKIINESTGALTDNVAWLCIRSKQGITTFDNADYFFIGNRSNPNVTAFGVLCANVSSGLILSVTEPASANDTYSFQPSNFPTAFFGNQAWQLSVWDSVDSRLNGDQTVDLTVSNFGETLLQFTGLENAAPGLDNETVFDIGNITTLALNRSAVNLTYDGLPILQAFLTSDQYSILLPANTPTVLILVKWFTSSSGPTDGVAHLTYVLILDNKAANYATRFSYFLYESTLYQIPQGAGNRRLLAASSKTVAPPAGCSKGCCKPAKPVPSTCVKTSKTYPACLTSCGCACK